MDMLQKVLDEMIAKTYLYVQAPPATVFMQDPQCQIPTALLFILVCKQTTDPLTVLLYDIDVRMKRITCFKER